MYTLLPRQYKVIEKINHDFCHSIRLRYPNDEEKVKRTSIIEDDKVRMANLALVGSHKINGVAKIHTNIIKKEVFKDFHDIFPDKFVNVTNGVTQRRWLLHTNPELADFITKRIGDEWIFDFKTIKNLSQYATDERSLEEFLAIKKRSKERAIQFLQQRGKLRNAKGQKTIALPEINANSLFEVHIKRIHEYKRQLMNLLHWILLYHEIIENPHQPIPPRTSILSGKAAAGYERAKEILLLSNAIQRKVNKDHAVGGKLVILNVENYNVTQAEILIPASDLSVQISTAGTEASGTGCMKLSMNGSLTIGTRDGSNIEMEKNIGEHWWPFGFGLKEKEITAHKKNQSYKPEEILKKYPKIAQAMESLRNHSFAVNEQEHTVFCSLYDMLINNDPFFVLADLQSYRDTQKQVEKLFQTPLKWAEYAIHNIAGMGYFSTDRSIQDYSNLIWGLTPCPPDLAILNKVQEEYSKHDQCRIY